MLIQIPQDRKLLTEEQLRQFLSNGYLELKITDVSFEMHQHIFQESEKLFKEEPNPGNNIMARIPAVSNIFTKSKVLLGALESILGPQIALQPHRFCHFSPPGFNAQNWHKDSYFGYVKPLRSNVPRYIMAMYYPQKVTKTKGPTAIKKETQYYCLDPKRYRGPFENTHSKNSQDKDEHMVCEAGTIALIHYDIIHKATQNLTTENRYMFKFQYNRLEEPVLYKFPFDFELQVDKIPNYMLPMVRFVWNWMRGKPAEKSTALIDKQKLLTQLRSKVEQDRFYAAFSLAQMDDQTILFSLLHNEQDVQYKTLASLALCSSPDLSKLVQDIGLNLSEETVNTMYYAFILSEVGSLVPSEAVKLVDQLIKICKESKDNLLRVYICEAITNIANAFTLQGNEHLMKQTASILNFVLIETREEFEEDNDRAALKNAEHARLTAALCMARLGTKLEAYCFETAAQAIEEEDNRYVVGNLLLALERMQSIRSLTKALQVSQVNRLCPFTTKESPF